MPRLNIYISDDLRRRMDAQLESANWSQVASEAFEARIAKAVAEASGAKAACVRCRFFVEAEDAEMGEGTCRRYPPRFFAVEGEDGPGSASGFPEAFPDEFCGEFQAKEQTA